MKKVILKSALAVVAVTLSCLGAWKAYEAYGTMDNSLMLENIEALGSLTEKGTGRKKYPEPVNCGTLKCQSHSILPWQWGDGNLCNPCCSAYKNADELKKEKSEKCKEQCWCTGPRQNLDASTKQRYGWCFPKDHY